MPKQTDQNTNCVDLQCVLTIQLLNRMNCLSTLPVSRCFYTPVSGQITIIPKLQLRACWGDSLPKPHFGVTLAQVVPVLIPSARETHQEADRSGHQGTLS